MLRKAAERTQRRLLSRPCCRAPVFTGCRALPWHPAHPLVTFAGGQLEVVPKLEKGAGDADDFQQKDSRTAGRHESNRVMTSHGLLPPRMQRVHILHTLLCQMAGILPAEPAAQQQRAARGQGQGGGAAAPAEAAAAGGQGAAEAEADAEAETLPVGAVFVQTSKPGSQMHVEHADVSTDAELARRLVTSRGIWRTLTAQQFVQIVGSVNRADDEEIR